MNRVVNDRYISCFIIVIGGVFLAMGTSWYIGVGAALLTWAGLPTLKVK